MSFAPIDFFFSLIILFFAINAALRGFVQELFSKAAFFLGIGAAFVFCAWFSQFLLPFVHYEALAKIIAFIVIFITVFLVFKLLQHLVGTLVESEIMSGLDKAMGFFFGVAEGLLIAGAALFLLHAQPFFDVNALLGDSFFEHIFYRILKETRYV